MVLRFLVCGALCAGLLGLRFLWLTPEEAIPLTAMCGYPLVLAAFAAWCFFAYRLGRERGWWQFRLVMRHWAVLTWAAAGAVFLQLHEPHRHKVLFDESTHSAMSLVMHLDKQAMMPGLSHYVGDCFVISHFYPSFRAYLFPLLGSLISDVTGYRVENLLILNGLLAFGILALSGIIGRRLGGRLGGFAAIGLLLGLPLLAQNATSYGYDLLNVFMLAVLTYVAVVMPTLEEPIQRRLFICFGTATAVLLAVCRYESILYLFPWALIVALQWKRWREVVMPWFSAVTPVLLLPSILSNLVMMRQGVEAYGDKFDAKVGFFSVSYLPAHVADAVYYFATLHSAGSNNPLLFAVGAVGGLFLLVRCARTNQRMLDGLLVLILATGLIYLGILTQFWSSPQAVVAARFTLPLWLLLTLTSAWLLGQISWLTRHYAVVVFGIVVWALVVAVPVSSKAFATQEMAPSGVGVVELEYAQSRPRTRTLYVAYSPHLLVAHRYACQGINMLNASPALFVRALKAGLYDEIVIFQRTDLDTVAPRGRPTKGHELAAEIVTELIEERPIRFTHSVRVYRLVGLRKADGTLVTPQSDDELVRLRTKFKDEDDFGRYRYSLYP